MHWKKSFTNGNKVCIELSLDEDIHHGPEGNPHGNEAKVVLERLLY